MVDRIARRVIQLMDRTLDVADERHTGAGAPNSSRRDVERELLAEPIGGVIDAAHRDVPQELADLRRLTTGSAAIGGGCAWCRPLRRSWWGSFRWSGGRVVGGVGLKVSEVAVYQPILGP